MIMDLYAENILDHYRHPRNRVSPLPALPTETLVKVGGRGVGEEGWIEHKELNPSCGDALIIRLSMKDGRITDLVWDGSGCAISQAAMSMLSDHIRNLQLAIGNSISAKDVYDLLGVPIGPRRVKCALLSLHTLKNALRQSRGLPSQGWTETMGK